MPQITKYNAFMDKKVLNIVREQYNDGLKFLAEDGIETVSFEDVMAVVEKKKISLERIQVKRTKSIDRDDLFGNSISDTIKFLHGIEPKNAILHERWSGYEDNYFEVEWTELEDDNEYALRVVGLLENAADEHLEQVKHDKELEERRLRRIDALEKELASLRKKCKK